MTEIIELKDFLMEEQYNINQHFTDLSSIWGNIKK